MISTQVQHAMTVECEWDHCFTHGVDEPSATEDYVACPSCNHVYRTRGTLIRTYWRALVRWPRGGAAWPLLQRRAWIFMSSGLTRVEICPLCASDLSWLP